MLHDVIIVGRSAVGMRLSQLLAPSLNTLVIGPAAYPPTVSLQHQLTANSTPYSNILLSFKTNNLLFSRELPYAFTTDFNNIKWDGINSIDGKVDHIDVSSTYPTISHNSTLLSSRLLVGADGRNSLVKKSSGIKTKFIKYNQTAIISKITHLNLFNGAFQRFFEFGIVGFIPISSTESCCILSINDTHIQNLISLPDSDYCKFINLLINGSIHDIEFMLSNPSSISTLDSKITFTSKRSTHELIASHVDKYIQDRIVLVGDAAHSIHPLAGMGMNLGLQDVECLARVINDIHSVGGDVGLGLEVYQQERYLLNVYYLAMVDLVYRFGGGYLADGVAFGLNRVPFMKQFVFR